MIEMKKNGFPQASGKGITNSVVLSPKIHNLVNRLTDELEISRSEWIRQAVIEKLERLSLITTPIKAEMRDPEDAINYIDEMRVEILKQIDKIYPGDVVIAVDAIDDIVGDIAQYIIEKIGKKYLE